MIALPSGNMDTLPLFEGHKLIYYWLHIPTKTNGERHVTFYHNKLVAERELDCLLNEWNRKSNEWKYWR